MMGSKRHVPHAPCPHSNDHLHQGDEGGGSLIDLQPELRPRGRTPTTASTPCLHPPLAAPSRPNCGVPVCELSKPGPDRSKPGDQVTGHERIYERVLGPNETRTTIGVPCSVHLLGNDVVLAPIVLKSDFRLQVFR